MSTFFKKYIDTNLHNPVAQITVIGIEPDPLGGVEGGSVLIYCSARNTNNGQFISPAKLDLLRNGVDLITMRLTVQSTNSTHRTFQLANLQLSDHGAEITCALSELRSEPVTMQIFCESVLSYNWRSKRSE